MPRSVIDNARALAATLTERGLKIVSGGTDSHVMLVDLRPKKATGVSAEKVLDRAGITTQQEQHSGRSGEVHDHVGRAPGLAGRHDARLRRRRVPARSAT